MAEQSYPLAVMQMCELSKNDWLHLEEARLAAIAFNRSLEQALDAGKTFNNQSKIPVNSEYMLARDVEVQRRELSGYLQQTVFVAQPVKSNIAIMVPVPALLNRVDIAKSLAGLSLAFKSCATSRGMLKVHNGEFDYKGRTLAAAFIAAQPAITGFASYVAANMEQVRVAQIQANVASGAAPPLANTPSSVPSQSRPT